MKNSTIHRINLNNSKKFLTKCRKYYPGGSHFNFATPQKPLNIPFKKAKGSRIWDLDNNEHLDLFNKFGALFVGHQNPHYNEAINEALNHANAVEMCYLEVEVAELFIDLVPSADQVRFCLSGTEAVQNALRLARGVTEKNRFIRFSGHYHGNADNIIGGYIGEMPMPVPKMQPNDILDTKGRARNILQEQSFLIPWNDIDLLRKLVENSDDIAAIIMEPISINGGGIEPQKGYLESVRKLCNDNNICLIFDEVITGFRAGLNGAQGLYKVNPDITIFGKTLGGGSLPVSAVTANKDIMKLYDDGKVIFAGTFNGYALGLAAIKATIEILKKHKDSYSSMEKNMESIGNLMISAAKENDIPMTIQGIPNALCFHPTNKPLEKSEDWSNSEKMVSTIIKETAKRYGIQLCSISRMYSNIMLSEDDVSFFEPRIYETMKASKKEIIRMEEQFSQFGIKHE